MAMKAHTSALKQHYLASIMPYNQSTNAPAQFLKNRQFYKPQQFIWNNPHRTSKKIYPYFHQANYQYMEHIKPKIDQLQEQDRISVEKQRIKKLTNMRYETRKQFLNRRKGREDLQSKVHSSANKKTFYDLQSLSQRTNSERGDLIIKRNSANSFNYPKTIDHESMPQFNKVRFSQNDITTSVRSRAITNPQEKNYEIGLKSYDKKMETIRDMIANQINQNRQKIRQSLQKQKFQNESQGGYIRKSLNIVKKRQQQIY